MVFCSTNLNSHFELIFLIFLINIFIQRVLFTDVIYVINQSKNVSFDLVNISILYFTPRSSPIDIHIVYIIYRKNKMGG